MILSIAASIRYPTIEFNNMNIKERIVITTCNRPFSISPNDNNSVISLELPIIRSVEKDEAKRHNRMINKIKMENDGLLLILFK